MLAFIDSPPAKDSVETSSRIIEGYRGPATIDTPPAMAGLFDYEIRRASRLVQAIADTLHRVPAELVGWVFDDDRPWSL